MTDTGLLIFTGCKQVIMDALNDGYVCKAQWDRLIAYGKEVGADNSVAELERLYSRYHIGELGINQEVKDGK